MKDLHGKNYPKVVGDDALELTVLFVPIEGVLAEAMATDPSLQTDAMKNNITFASPNTLMALLKVVERMWVRDKFQTQVEAIRKVASNLMDSLTAFLTEFNAIEDKLGGVTKAYGQAKHRLYESNQSVVARGKKLVDAGAPGNKALHKDLMPDQESIEEPTFFRRSWLSTGQSNQPGPCSAHQVVASYLVMRLSKGDGFAACPAVIGTRDVHRKVTHP